MSVNAVHIRTFLCITASLVFIHAWKPRFTVWEVFAVRLWVVIFTSRFFAEGEEFAFSGDLSYSSEILVQSDWIDYLCWNFRAALRFLRIFYRFFCQLMRSSHLQLVWFLNWRILVIFWLEFLLAFFIWNYLIVNYSSSIILLRKLFVFWFSLRFWWIEVVSLTSKYRWNFIFLDIKGQIRFLSLFEPLKKCVKFDNLLLIDLFEDWSALIKVSKV